MVGFRSGDKDCGEHLDSLLISKVMSELAVLKPLIGFSHL